MLGDDIRNPAAIDDDAVHAVIRVQLLAQCADAGKHELNRIQRIDALKGRGGGMAGLALEVKFHGIQRLDIGGQIVAIA